MKEKTHQCQFQYDHKREAESEIEVNSPVTTRKKINFDRHTLVTQGTDSRLLSFAISNNKKNMRAHMERAKEKEELISD